MVHNTRKVTFSPSTDYKKFRTNPRVVPKKSPKPYEPKLSVVEQRVVTDEILATVPKVMEFEHQPESELTCGIYMLGAAVQNYKIFKFGYGAVIAKYLDNLVNAWVRAARVAPSCALPMCRPFSHTGDAVGSLVR